MPIDVQGFYPDNTPNPALGQIANTIQENTRYKQERDYRKQKDEEANQYRNLNLIQDGTDISKSVTGIQAVDKAFADKMKVAYGELLEASKHLSPIELAGMVNEKTQPILSASTAARNDYLNGQKLITEMTAQSKELNRAGLTNDLTGKVINNYIDPKTGQPVNPDMVHPIDFSIYNDPEYLSGFVSDENLVKGIRNPVGAEPQTVLAGKPHNYTEYSTKNTFWTEPTYDKAKIDKQGFYTGGDVPQKRIKSQQVSLGGGNMDVVTDDVYNAFTGDMATHAAIVARAKKEFPTYDKFNTDERKLAQKHALYKTITENDDTQFHPTKTVAPPVYHNRTTNNINTGGKEPLNLNNYTKVGDDYDITKLLQGVNVVNKGGVKNLTASKVLYNPDKKSVTFTDVAGDTETVDFDTFRQNIATINTGIDLKQVDRLPLSGRPSQSNTPKPTGNVTVVLKDGRKGEIPADKVTQFLKDNPGSKRQ